MPATTLRPFRLTTRLIASIAIVASFACAAVAGAAPEANPAATTAEQWKGRSCTKPGCAPSESAPWGHAAGFGAAVVTAGLVARRRE